MGESFSLFTIVPLVFVGIGLWEWFKAVRDLVLVRRLLAVPAVRGTVVSSQLHHSQSGSSSRSTTSRLVETIEFASASGRTVRANPAVVESGSVDRTGMDVVVHADPERPERFIAPLGDSFSSWIHVGRAVKGLGSILAGVAFLLVTRRITSGFPGPW